MTLLRLDNKWPIGYNGRVLKETARQEGIRMNAELLREVMREKGISIKTMCEELGISRKTFWKRCTGKTEFKQSEIVKIIDLVGKEYGVAIFFPA